MFRRLLLLFVPVVLAMAACGGGGGSNAASPSAPSSSGAQGGTPPPAACSPSGTKLQISAQNIAFDKDCLAAPAGEAFTITFDNKDAGVPHNIDIMTSETGGKDLFKGDLVTGVATTTYHVSALQPGTYHFHCDVHPSTMSGTFVVA